MDHPTRSSSLHSWISYSPQLGSAFAFGCLGFLAPTDDDCPNFFEGTKVHAAVKPNLAGGQLQSVGPCFGFVTEVPVVFEGMDEEFNREFISTGALADVRAFAFPVGGFRTWSANRKARLRLTLKGFQACIPTRSDDGAPVTRLSIPIHPPTDDHLRAVG